MENLTRLYEKENRLNARGKHFLCATLASLIFFFISFCICLFTNSFHVIAYFFSGISIALVIIMGITVTILGIQQAKMSHIITNIIYNELQSNDDTKDSMVEFVKCTKDLVIISIVCFDDDLSFKQVTEVLNDSLDNIKSVLNRDIQLYYQIYSEEY